MSNEVTPDFDSNMFVVKRGNIDSFFSKVYLVFTVCVLRFLHLQTTPASIEKRSSIKMPSN